MSRLSLCILVKLQRKKGDITCLNTSETTLSRVLNCETELNEWGLGSHVNWTGRTF